LVSTQGTSATHLGGTRIDRSAVEFLVWAPRAERVEVRLAGAGDQYLPLRPEEFGYFHGIADVRGEDCRYWYRLNGGLEHPDPASRYQPDGVHSASSVVERDYPWTDSHWYGLTQEDYIFYEIHVGTFTGEGSFDAVASKLRDLQDLGITALELMPVAQFPQERNWGYDGVYPFAAQASYGGPLALKRLVDACHRTGLAVVLDVVYNHLGPEGNYLADFGPYFTDRYHTPWGPAVNFDGPQSDHVVRYFVENALQWLDEFHIDALRLDAIHGIVDRNAQPFLSCLSAAVEKLAAEQNRRIYLFAESDVNDARFFRPRDAGGIGLHAQWSDDFHHALHSLQTGERDGYYADFGTVEQLGKAMRNGYVFDGQYSKYRQRRQGNSPVAMSGRQFVVCSQNHDQVGNRMLGDRSSTLLSFEAQKLSAATVLLSPFLPLLFMGEEFGDTAPFLYFTSHTDPALCEAVRVGRKNEFAAFAWKGEPPDPQSDAAFLASKVNHALAEKEPNRTLRAFYQALIRLRKSTPALGELNKDCVEAIVDENQQLLCVRRWKERDEVLLLLNFGQHPAHPPELSLAGKWDKMLDSADERWFGPGSTVPQTLQAPGPRAWQLAPKSACVLQRAGKL
jgi:maltooligosyltrehalose trehalohydrolase